MRLTALSGQIMKSSCLPEIELLRIEYQQKSQFQVGLLLTWRRSPAMTRDQRISAPPATIRLTWLVPS
jgi:hypothetical protein